MQPSSDWFNCFECTIYTGGIWKLLFLFYCNFILSLIKKKSKIVISLNVKLLVLTLKRIFSFFFSELNNFQKNWRNFQNNIFYLQIISAYYHFIVLIVHFYIACCVMCLVLSGIHLLYSVFNGWFAWLIWSSVWL